MKKKEFKNLKEEELEKLLLKLKDEYFKLNSSSLAGEDSQKKKSRLKVIKRDIARVLTKLNS